MYSIDFLTPEPMNPEALLDSDMVELTWMEPSAGMDAMATLAGYNIYQIAENSDWKMLARTENNYFVHKNLQSTGTHY